MRLVLPIAAMSLIGALAAFFAVMINGSVMESRISLQQAETLQLALGDAYEREAARPADYLASPGPGGVVPVTASGGRQALAPSAAARRRLAALVQGSAQNPAPVPLRLDGQIYLAQPSSAGSVALRRLDPAFFSAFAARYGLDGLAPSPERLPPSMFRNQIPLIPGDYSQGGLHWSVHDRVRDNASSQVNFALALMLMIGGGGFYAYRRTRRLAQSLVSSEAHAQHLALHDPMTGLANRALFANRLDLAMDHRRRSGGAVAVFVVDLDRFKQVNDSLGHQAGDELIRYAARRLLSICRATDTVARLGGDEFAVVAQLPHLSAVPAMMDRLMEALSGQVALPGGVADLRGSVGLAVIEDDIEAAEAMRRADMAMYRAKEQGRGRCAVFEPTMDESQRLRRETEVELRRALAEGALEVHYQPQFMARSGKLESVEALVRWNSAERGYVSPAYFIPIAEECGLIDQLGEMVMRQACTDARRWPQLKVAINISPVQLRRPNFVATCERILAETGADAELIEFEITEGVLLEDDEGVQTCLKRLRALGIKLALDDFGTGYSSLSYLNAYPVDKIKIDRSFISQLGVQEDADKVIRAIVRLGKALGLQVTAEGVETEAQRKELISAGCNVLQGFLGGRPGDAGAIDELVRAHKAGAHAA